MTVSIPHLPTDDKFCHLFSLPILEQLYSRELVSELLSQFGLWEQRERKLNQLLMVYLLIAWHLFVGQSLRSVCLRLSAAWRLLAALSPCEIPSAAALTYRRKQLGVRLFRTLMRRVCQPLATPETPGRLPLACA
jgi:Insertion element 4 transposase N-terminal